MWLVRCALSKRPQFASDFRLVAKFRTTSLNSHLQRRLIPQREPLSTMAPSTKTAGKKSAGKTGRSAIADVVAREYTIHLHKRVHGVSFKKRAPKAVKEIRAFAKQAMGTNDVRLDPQLNKKVWESGIKGVPFRLRVRISRKRNDEEGAKEKLYSYVQAVNVKDPKGLHTQIVEDA
ncbi:60S ribosomal protein L31 [Pyrenophora teres f. teres]|nr:60S ribosomal protein L31 [Pyrenophora teres f. teres]